MTASTASITASNAWPHPSPRVAKTLWASAVLWGLYFGYLLVVTPFIAPPELAEGRDPDHVAPPPPRNSVRMAERFLPSVPWAANAKYQLRTKEAYVFFEEWERVESQDSVRFAPFAIVWMQDENAQRDGPITVVAESAFVKFANAFEITNDPGRVVAAAFEGRAELRGPDGLHLVGEDFTYSESAARIWTDGEVRFAHGRSSGVGRGLQMELVPAEDPEEHSIAVVGMRSLRLRHDVRMHLVGEPEADSIGNTDRSDAPERDANDEPVTVVVTSDGPFEYVADTLIATFEDNVFVDRPTTDSQSDTLSCDLLTLVFEPNREGVAEAVAVTESSAETDLEGHGGFRRVETDLVFHRMQATGEHVRLRSAENELDAHMTKLVYDAETRIVAASAPKSVRVLHRGNELRSPEITLVQGESGDVRSAWCQGAGWMKHRDEKTGRVDLEAKWEKQMRIHPDVETGFELIELEEEALVRQVEAKSALQAGFIRLWIERIDGPAPTQRVEAATATATSTLRDGRVRPRKMLAIDDVVMVATDLEARTKRLEVWFEHAETATDREPPRTLGRVGRRFPPRVVPVVERRPRVGQFFASQADPIVSRRSRACRSPQLPTEDGPAKLEADLVRVRIVDLGHPERDPRAAEVWTFGNVHVTQLHADGKSPLDVTGERMHLLNGGEGRELLHVYGSVARRDREAVPARIRDRGLHVEGAVVHLDRNGNRAWVEGAGLLQLPVERSLDGEELESPQTLDVWWDESMNFDGSRAVFLGRVRAVLEESRMHCAEMHVHMTKRLSFVDGPGEERPDVKSIECLDGVTFENRKYEKSKLVGLQRAKMWTFALNQQTGDTHAVGPGWITSWSRGRGNRAGLAPTAVVRPNAPLATDSAEWEYSRIDFEGTARGNVRRRDTTFHDQVEIVYGPVDRPLGVIDPDRLPRDAGLMRCRSLQLQQHEKTAHAAAYFTALARGNVYLHGETFFARSDEVTFDESKGRYVLRSGGDRRATIWRETPTGELDDVSSKRIEFVPSRKILRLDRTSGANGSG